MNRLAKAHARVRKAVAKLTSRGRLIWVGLILSTAIAADFGEIMDREKQASIDDYTTAQTKLASSMASQTAHFVAPAVGALASIPRELVPAADATAARTQAALRSPAAFDLLANRQKSVPGIEAIALVDRDGVIATASPGWPPSVRDVSGTAFFRQFGGAGDGSPSVGEPARDTASGKWSVLLGWRIDDGDRVFAGLLLARFSLSDLQELYQMAMPTDRILTVMRRDGVVLVRYPPADDLIGRRVPEASPWHDTLAHASGAYHGPGLFSPPPMVASVRPIAGLPLLLAAAATEAEALASWYPRRAWLISGGGVAELFVVALLWLLGIQFRRLETAKLALAQRNGLLETTRRQFDAALSNIAQGISFFGTDRRLIVCNTRFGEIYNLPPEATLVGAAFEEITDACIAAGSFPEIDRDAFLLSHEAELGRADPSYAIRHLRDGRTLAVQQQPLSGGAWVATHEDVTERRKAEEQILYLARHDVLTGLANRTLFQERIDSALAAARRGGMFAILCLDLDRFKAVNDTFGHQMGDELLRAAAARLLIAVREQDTVARFGGDEFVVLQLGLHAIDDATRLARRIIEALVVPFFIGGQQLVVGASIGIAIAPNDAEASETLLKNADMALYISKAGGRGAYRFFAPSMDAMVQDRHAIERDLRTAIEREEFALRYMPIVDIRSGAVSTVEVLIRWMHPERGMVPPGIFIPIAEDCGQIVQIGEWVLARACRQAAKWPDHVHIAVNFSPIQFRAGNLVEVVAAALASSGLPARRLEVEITESILLSNNEANLETLHRLHGLGVKIAMDDFGIGYSSLSYLCDFPFDKVKIDQSFIKDITTRNDIRCIVRAIAAMCQGLGIRATVEGVETEEQLAIVVAEGCTEAQGYYFGVPGTAAEISEMIQGGPLIPARLRQSLEQVA